MDEHAYLLFLSIVIVTVGLAALSAAAFFSIPEAWRSYRYWDNEGNLPRRVYAFWRLTKTTVAAACVLCFVIVAFLPLVIEDPTDYVRQFVARHLILAAMLGMSLLVIIEPVSDRRIDRALRAEGSQGLGPHNGGRWPDNHH